MSAEKITEKGDGGIRVTTNLFRSLANVLLLSDVYADNVSLRNKVWPRYGFSNNKMLIRNKFKRQFPHFDLRRQLIGP